MPKRAIILQPEALEDLEGWVQTDRKVALRVLRLIDSVQRTRFRGLGKPKPLKHIGSDVWSRRVTRQERLVYRVPDTHIDVLHARHHY